MAPSTEDANRAVHGTLGLKSARQIHDSISHSHAVSKTITSGSIDDLKENGLYYIQSGVSDAPQMSSFLEVMSNSTGTVVIQRLSWRWTIYMRYYSSSSWKEWKSVALA